MRRFCLKITGESGAGLLSTGEILTESFNAMGYFVVADREYPSLIKGGASCFMVNVSDGEIFGLSERVDVMLSIDKQSLLEYFGGLREEGVLVYGYERPLGVKDVLAELEAKRVKVVHAMSRELAENAGGNVLMVNMVMIGMLWKVLGLPYQFVEEEVKKKFASKPKLLAIDLDCLRAGFEACESVFELFAPGERHGRVLRNGHQTLCDGAIVAGVGAYFAYPMSPSSNILSYMAEEKEKRKEKKEESELIVKQIEDEISVVNMTLGAMFVGMRAFCGTSGGGFDLMTETVSLAGIIENPLVVVLAQRPGPGTGLPTWTGQGDLNLALYSSHGEFARVVVALSDPVDAHRIIQEAFNLAEVYQVPVIILSEKQIAETIVSIKEPSAVIEVRRGLVVDVKGLKPEDRYEITESGVSRRWLPGASKEAYYCANGDEHWLDGSLTEKGDEAREMYAKRVRKLDAIAKELPQAEVLGCEVGAEISFVGWGSTKSVMRDFIAQMEKDGKKVNYLHFNYLWPLKSERFLEFVAANENVHLIEGNYTGQLGDLIKKETGFEFKGRLLKWDGRQFYLEDLINYCHG
ncbi:2-oxoacid:acceptor oxidoreductase subunit alpha [Candidatus Gracilibacteria bacterium]|nr:2-oxoacid:acceptor oxidoreductase subunit alpha [Candidatus Gracilibacteria bacterium]